MGSFPVDIDLRFDQASAQRALKDFAAKSKQMMADVAAGVEGSSKRMEKALNDFASGVITNSTRAGRQVENQIRAVERWADAAGKTASQQTQERYQRMIKSLEGNEKGIQRVTAAMQKWATVEKDQVKKALDDEIKSLEKRAALMGKSPADRMKIELAERTAGLKDNVEAVNRLTAAYQMLADAEKQEANAAREHEIQGIQRRGQMAGATSEDRLIIERGEAMAKYNNDARVALSYDQQLAAARNETAEATEREIQALERRGHVAGATDVERLEIERAQAMEKYNNNARVALSYDRQIAAERLKETQAVEKSIVALERRAALQGLSGEAKLRAELAQQIALYNGDAVAIARVTAAYERMILAEKAGSKSGTLSLFGRGARDLWEGRPAYGLMDILRGTAGTMEGGVSGGAAIGVGVGAAAAGIAAAGVVGYKAAEGVGELANKIHEVQIATGMSAEEVQRFQVAEKIAGAGAVDATRLMRGLTSAVMDNTTVGEKARKGLRDLGVDYIGIQLGTVSTSQALEQLSRGLKANGDVFETNSALMETFKRLGIEGKDTIIEYGDALKKTEGIQFLDQDQVDLMKHTNDELAVMKAGLGAIFTQIELIIGSGFVEFMEDADAVAQKFVKYADPMQYFHREKVPNLTPDDLPQPEGLAIGRKAYHDALEKRRLDFLRTLPDDDSMQQELERRKKEFETAKANTKLSYKDFPQYQSAVTATGSAYTTYKAEVDAQKKLEELRRTISDDLKRLPVDVEDRLGHPDELPSEARLRKFKDAAQGLPPGERRTAIAKYTQQVQPLIDRDDADRKAKFAEQKLQQQQTFQREMLHTQFVAPVNIRELGQTGVTRADVESDINRQYQQRMDNAGKLHDLEVSMGKERLAVAKNQEQRDAAELSAIQIENDYRKQGAEADMEREEKRYALAQRERDLEREHKEKMSEIQLSDQEDTIKHTADVARKTADLRFHGDSPAESIAAEYRIAVQESHDLFDAEMDRIALHETGYRAAEAAQQAINKLRRQDEAASEDSAFKLAEMQQKQLDTLKSKIEPLYQTLFTNPKNFGKQLRSTVTEAALHPIVSGMSEMTSRALSPFIYGPEGTTGIAGMFGNLFGGGGAHNVSQIKPVHDAMPVWIMNLPHTERFGPSPGYIDSGGGGVTSSYTPGIGYSGGGGTFGGGINFMGGGAVGADAARVFRSLGIAPSVSIGGGGGTANRIDFGGGGDGGGGTGAGIGSADTGGGGMSMDEILGLPHTSRIGPVYTGGGAGSPFGGLLKSLKGSFMPSSYTGLGGEKIYTGAASGFGANLGGVLSSQGAAQLYMGAGLPLAMAGITGVHRGTAGGTVESMLGGAGVGAGIGTMFMPGLGTAIGAGVGAAAGLGIGLGEMLAGVESPRHEAIRLAQSLYRIHISNSAADQVVSIAQQNYGGQVSVAIRSPEVRKMMGLYAAGTGQSNLFPQSMDTPHGASLVESGGKLYQQATYQYGQAYSQSSNLPVYGGVQTQTLGAPGAVNLALNINGQNAAQFLQGNIVSPDVVSTQYAQAMDASNGRVSQALMMSEPGAITGALSS